LYILPEDGNYCDGKKNQDEKNDKNEIQITLVEFEKSSISLIVSKTQTIKDIRELLKNKNKNIDNKILIFGSTFILLFYFFFIIGTVLKDEDTISNVGIEDGNVIFIVPNSKEEDIHIFVIGV
jgi:hypothetical protein